MEKRNKGFTLIELLAVIVILAVIALIATPIIMNVINDSKKGSAKDSMYSYVKAVELAATKNLNPDTDLMSGTYTVKDGNLYSGSTKILDIDLKGTKPVDGIGTIVLEKGQVKNSDLKFDEYCVGYNGTEVVNKDNCSSSPVVSSTYTAGDVIYYNPETNKKCTSAEVNTTVNAKTGCLKWNVITTGDTISKTTIDIMLDHNSTAIVAWNLSGNNVGGMKEVETALKSDVSTWDPSVKSRARLISGQELANIIDNTEWNPGKSSFIPFLSQPWIYQNTYNNGDNTTQGYWTSTANTYYSSNAWFVAFRGFLEGNLVGSAGSVGARPVITVSKSVIS